MSMYEFHDVTEGAPREGLPAEALCFDGVWLDNEVTGFRTLYVKGREAISANIDYLELPVRDGAKYKRSRYEPRTLMVGYKLTADTAQDMMTAYNRLLSILSTEQAKVRFADESDKYYVGTKTQLPEVHPGRLSVTGEIEILCTDPFKYRTTATTVQHTVVDGSKVITLNYDGTYPAHPILTATSGSDNGFYGFVNDKGAILQFGDPDEVDTEERERSQTLLYHKFNAGIPSGWTRNNGTTSTPSVDIQTGSFGTGRTHETKGTGIDASLGSYGSGSYWHGPSINYVLPADSNGETGAKNFRFACQMLFFAYETKEVGMSQINIVGTKNGSKYILAGFEFMAGSTNSHTSEYRLWVNGQIVEKGYTTVRHDNPYTGVDTGELVIFKSGSEIRFYFGDERRSFKSSAYTNLEALEVTLYGAVHGSKTKILQNAFFNVKFRKDLVTYDYDVPNKFTADDVLEVHTSTGAIVVNGTVEPDLGAVGNEWEDFVLWPGVNNIICAASDWVDTDSYTLRYREVYL